MLNRRYLRIKVFQSLYAYWQSDSASAARIEKEMLNSIDRTTDLFLALVQVFGELRHMSELRIEERRKKRLPTAEDLEPNLRFVQHPIVVAITENERLRTECEKRRVSWVGNTELFGRLLRDVEADDAFKAFLNDPAPTFRKDQNYLVRLFTDHIANSEALQEVFETRSIHWMEDMDLAAAMVKRTIEALKEEDVLLLQLDDLDRDVQEDLEFTRSLYRRSIELGDEHEAAIAAKASNWESDRIALSDMILMKMALAEVRSFDQIPIKVTLNEYIEVAKAYSTPKSKNFINGVLDKLFIEMRAEGLVHKVGRGLLES
jgi:N utilization substance protein B